MARRMLGVGKTSSLRVIADHDQVVDRSPQPIAILGGIPARGHLRERAEREPARVVGRERAMVSQRHDARSTVRVVLHNVGLRPRPKRGSSSSQTT